MAFDECTPYPATEAQAADSMRLSMRWAGARATPSSTRGLRMFGIVQGGVFDELRAESAAALRAIGFDGYAVGGLAVGEGQARCNATLDATVPLLPQDAPRYLMGVGKPLDIVEAVARGIDMFDCVLPTRSGRTGRPSRASGELNLRNARHADDRGRSIRIAAARPAAATARLSPSPGQGGRDARRDAADPAQPPLLPGRDARDARRDRGRKVRCLPRCLPCQSCGARRRRKRGDERWLSLHRSIAG
jgi:hypothetical protein